MKINIKLNVSDKDFYNFLILNLEEEIAYYTKKNIKPYAGFSYKKQLSGYNKHERNVDVIIKNLVENELYIVNFKTKLDVTRMTYKIEKINDNNIVLIYEQNYINDNKVVRLNFSLITFVLTPVSRFKIKKKFKKIAKYINENKTRK